METVHQIFFQDSASMAPLAEGSAGLVVTSPPYPMVEMWDDLFTAQDERIKEALEKEQGPAAFRLMHRRLAPVWEEVLRILRPGGLACINIGDAARTMGGEFNLYPNHTFILDHLLEIGFSVLPLILWRKQTNAPNKFMGSGMLPAGAYVTLEHELILIVRKGSKREFSGPAEKRLRRESAFFWEERNTWFSDVWLDLKGARQDLGQSRPRLRSGAFPFELAFRLISMFSVQGDLVVDPFLGTGTTTCAAMAAGRSSAGFEVAPGLEGEIRSKTGEVADLANDYNRRRLARHLDFVRDRFEAKGPFKHRNVHYGFPVVTAQEKELLFQRLKTVREEKGNTFIATYSGHFRKEFQKDWEGFFGPAKVKTASAKRKAREARKGPVQPKLID